MKHKNYYINKIGGVRFNKHWKGKTYSADAIYIKKNSDIIKLNKIKILKFLDVLCSYQLYDRALNLIDLLKSKKKLIKKNIFF